MRSRLLLALAMLAILCGCGPSAGEKAARAELADAQKQLAAARVELATATAEIKHTRERLADEQSLRKAEVEKSAKDLEGLQMRLNDAQSKLMAAQSKIQGLEAEIRKSAPPPEYEIAGEIFIVTKGRENLRLGRVEVAAIERGTLEAYLGPFIAKRAEEMEKLKPLLEAATEEKNDEQAKVHVLAEAYRNNDQRGPAARIRELEWLAAIKRHNAASDVLSQLTDKRSKFMSARDVFNALPTPICSVKSNADGKFTLRVPRDREVVLVAHATRETGSILSESYFWMVPVKRPSSGTTEVTLSNDNLCSVKGGSLFYAED